MPGTTFNILVLGDSAAWGQGLQPQDKFPSLVAAAIRAGNPTLTVRDPIIQAHSGAIIRDPNTDTPPTISLPKEVPTFYPTILDQCRMFTGPPEPEEIDLILVNGGANDVGITTFLNPQTTPATISSLVTSRIYTNWKERLLPELLRTFDYAKIVVIGYYPIVSDLTGTDRLEWLCVGEFSWPRWLAVLAGSPFLDWMKQQVYENCRTFAWGARNCLLWAVEESSAAWNRPIYFADPWIGGGFNERHSIFTADPWVFGLLGGIGGFPNLIPEDTINRTDVCQQAFPSDAVNRQLCILASAGHPNPRGARAYADAILAALYAPRLIASVSPSPVPLGVPTSIVVSAVRFDNRTPVPGTVRIRNFDAFGRAVYLEFPTGTQYAATFRTGLVRQFDPETKKWIGEETDPGGVVLATGYPSTKVPFVWT
jgi:lysophospholipase L1-like esterase